eukprot:scaffold69302_cov68-Phaeocystis_antarctica.AAC.9
MECNFSTRAAWRASRVELSRRPAEAPAESAACSAGRAAAPLRALSDGPERRVDAASLLLPSLPPSLSPSLSSRGGRSPAATAARSASARRCSSMQACVERARAG